MLSGFLITLLLLRESNLFGSISVKHFYIRRILRIWPLYYFVVLLGFFVLPQFGAYAIGEFPQLTSEHFWQKLFLYVIFAPQVAGAIIGHSGYAGVLWSVGVEEWFYLIWPWVVVMMRRWLIPILLVTIYIFGYYRWHVPAVWLHKLLLQLRFDCLAVGALGGILCSSVRWRPIVLRSFLFSRPAQLIVLATLSYCLWFGVDFFDKDEWIYSMKIGKYFFNPDELIYSMMFLWLIINVSHNKASILNLDIQPLKFIGKVSYGVYCYNWIAIVTGLAFLRSLGVNLDHGPARYFSYVFGLALSVAFAALSYRLIEKPFLALKDRSFTPHFPLTRPERRGEDVDANPENCAIQRSE